MMVCGVVHHHNFIYFLPLWKEVDPEPSLSPKRKLVVEAPSLILSGSLTKEGPHLDIKILARNYCSISSSQLSFDQSSKRSLARKGTRQSNHTKSCNFFYVHGPLDIYFPLDNQWIGTNFMGRQREAWGVYHQEVNLMCLHL